MFDWQTLAVALIIAAACLYVGRRALARLRSLRLGGERAAGVCETGCGNCESSRRSRTPTAPALVQIISARETPPRR